MLEKILLTLSGAIGIALVWVVITNVKIRAFVQKVRDAAADGKITAEEGIALRRRSNGRTYRILFPDVNPLWGCVCPDRFYGGKK